MAALLAASMAGVLVYCLARLLRAPVDDPAHRRDLDGWHALMALAMAAMLVATYTRTASLIALVVFAVGTGWSLVHLSAPGNRAPYVRLGLGCTAMVAMLVPAATASATVTTAPATAIATASANVTGHGAHHAAHLLQTTPGAAGTLVPPTVLVIALLSAFALVIVVRLAGTLRGGETVSGRLGAGCDVAMAAAMGYMLVAFL